MSTRSISATIINVIKLVTHTLPITIYYMAQLRGIIKSLKQTEKPISWRRRWWSSDQPHAVVNPTNRPSRWDQMHGKDFNRGVLASWVLLHLNFEEVSGKDFNGEVFGVFTWKFWRKCVEPTFIDDWPEPTYGFSWPCTVACSAQAARGRHHGPIQIGMVIGCILVYF